MTIPREAEHYLMPAGIHVPVRVAAEIMRLSDLGSLRVSRRGADPEFDSVVRALHLAALAYRSSGQVPQTGSVTAGESEPVASSECITPSQAAGLVGVTDRAIRKAIKEGRLPATQVGAKRTKYLIDRDDLENYRAARAARVA